MALSRRACLQVDEDTYLGMREEYMRMKRKSQDDHQKMRECVASPLILAQCMLRPPLFFPSARTRAPIELPMLNQLQTLISLLLKDGDYCRLASQLARTEEAAKRLMVRQDKSARGGVAARLLAAEKELSRVSADATEARSMRSP